MKHNKFWNDNLNKCDIFDNCIENDIKLLQCIKMFIIIEKRYNDAIFGCKDIKCESCGKLFTQAGNMRRHIKTLLQLFMKKWKN